MKVQHSKDLHVISWILSIAMANLTPIGAHEAVLMDTRTATSDVGWTMSQGSEWQEVSSNHPDGSERRMLMVCKIHIPKQNNWVRSPYIPIEGAERVYVEFEFTIRSCEDVENVATCKETFNLYYYETNSDEATTTFPPWREGAYVKVDTIAADKRFKPGSAETNFETRDIGPLSKNGIYLALQDTGACMALMHVRVYYKYCSPTVQNLAEFGRTVSGPEKTSLVEAEGFCVDHAFLGNERQATLLCNSDGEWSVAQGQCRCGAGYEPNPTQTLCRACGRGLYKASMGNKPCKRCPAYSHSPKYGATVCECMFGYFRATLDESSSTCTKPPSKPTNLRSVENNTRVTLTWNRPLNDGGRDDLTYRVECSRCQSGFTSCIPCSDNIDYAPMQTGISRGKVEIRHLNSFAYYKFKVFAENLVSNIAIESGAERDYAEATLQTSRAIPNKVQDVHVSQVTSTSFVITWNFPKQIQESVKEYEVKVTDYFSQDVRINRTTSTNMKVYALREGTDYTVSVRAKTLLYGPFSDPMPVRTRESEVTPPQNKSLTDEPVISFHILIAIVVSIVFLAVVLIGAVCLRRRSKKQKQKSKIYFEKYPNMFATSSLLSNGSYPQLQKTYIDPTTYEDPQRAVLDFTKEIDSTRVAIQQVIGGGEFGEVCRGHVTLPSSKEDHDVAIKTLKTGYSTQQKLDFLGEASIMGQFEHPNVIRLEGVVTRSRPLMIITEYMENGSLDNFLRKNDGKFTVVQLTGMLRNIAAGMKYLSDMGYVHRDLAARNILVNAQFICKVSDFGLSRVLEDDGDATYTTRGGKIPIRWTAPEAITYRKFTSASDVWSFGIVMWEVMSYGERPYWSMSNHDVIQAVGTGFRLPAPMDCPQVQHQLMIECWKKDRNERPKFSAILLSLDRMLRDPSQLKTIAGQQESRNGLHYAGGSLAHLHRPNHHEEKMLSVPLLGSYSSRDMPMNILAKRRDDLLPLENWLESIGLEAYKDTFFQHGYTSLKQVLQMRSSELENLGVSDINHQKALLDGIFSLQSENEYFKGQDSSPFKDNRVTGIPV